jgi:uncharacterized SAM-binding protein YcdF (DUF218 family)
MNLIKMVLTSLILPPGIFIVIILFTSKHYFFKKSYSAGFSFLIMALLIWSLSIHPTSDLLLSDLEYSNPMPTSPDALSGDVIILLGNGQYSKSPDLTGIGSPSEEMFVRLFTAYRLSDELYIPIIVCGYDIDTDNPDRISMIERMLTDFGVPEDQIIIESSSRDTIENAKNAKAICHYMGFENPILVTSAFHMKRAVLSFKHAGLAVLPIAASFKSISDNYYTFSSFLPEIEYLNKSTIAIREYIGLAIYNIFY